MFDRRGWIRSIHARRFATPVEQGRPSPFTFVAPFLCVKPFTPSSPFTLLSTFLVEREDAPPIVLHADDGPTLLRGFVVQRLGEGADLGVGQPLSRSVGVLARRIVVKQQHHQSSTAAG